MKENTVNEGKTTAIISYITIIGTILALLMNSSKKNSFAAFHIRQMMGLVILGLINQYFIKAYFSDIAAVIIAIGLFISWIIGFVGAVKGQEKVIPFIGDKFQELFRNIN